MKLKEFKDIIDKAYKYAEDCDVDVEIYIDRKGNDDLNDMEFFEIKRVGQFQIIPDLTIELINK